VELEVGGVRVHYVEHGAGAPVLVLHGAGVDHREAEACFDRGLSGSRGLHRIYPDLPGLGRTAAPVGVDSGDDVLELLIRFAERVSGGGPLLVIGHSAGAYYAHGLAADRPDLLAGLALVCPLLADQTDVPAHRPVVSAPALGDHEFRSYFVVQTPTMLERYERFVAPAALLVDEAATERIGGNWELSLPAEWSYAGPTLIVAGRQDSVVGYAGAMGLLPTYPRATLAVLDGAGHALPHERPGALDHLIGDWLARVAEPEPG
jgi:pimeloyl-ACP methyl ester carboxylesterase